MLSVTTPAPTRRLTRLEHVTGEIGSADAATIARLIDHASAAIENYCGGLPFARELVVESVPGYGGLELGLSRTPITVVDSVLFDSEVVTDYVIGNRDEGMLYRQAGWSWTDQVALGLAGRQRWPGRGSPLPRGEEPRFAVTYLGGYIVPEQNREGVATVSVDGADDSFNDTAALFPSLLRAGDVVVASGFGVSANNGRFVVAGVPTASKIPVSAALATESASVGRTLTFEPPGGCRPFLDVEKACIETVKAWWFERASNPNVTEKQVGGLRISHGGGPAAPSLRVDYQGLPAICVGLLRPWIHRGRAA